MMEFIKYITSSLLMFIAFLIVSSLIGTFFLELIKLMMWSKREYIQENERLKLEIESLTEQLEEGESCQ